MCCLVLCVSVAFCFCFACGQPGQGEAFRGVAVPPDDRGVAHAAPSPSSAVRDRGGEVPPWPFCFADRFVGVALAALPVDAVVLMTLVGECTAPKTFCLADAFLGAAIVSAPALGRNSS